MMIVYRVQSCPGREEVRERLLTWLPSSVEVVIDDGPDPNPWRGFQVCIKPPVGATHLCILQDDAIVCQNFPQAVQKIVESQPKRVICLFVPGSAIASVREMTKARAARRPFAVRAFRDFVPVVATIWPVEKAEDLLEWAETAALPGMPKPVRSDDAVCGKWARERKETVLMTVPSLVEHPDDVPSTISDRAKAGADRGRIAAYWIGDGDPLEIDWL